MLIRIDKFNQLSTSLTEIRVWSEKITQYLFKLPRRISGCSWRMEKPDQGIESQNFVTAAKNRGWEKKAVQIWRLIRTGMGERWRRNPCENVAFSLWRAQIPWVSHIYLSVGCKSKSISSRKMRGALSPYIIVGVGQFPFIG